MNCCRCEQVKDLAIIEINGEDFCYCSDCRKSLFNRKNPVGRPGIGVTKKVSLTLEESDWNEFEELAGDNKSKYLRQVVIKEIDKKNNPSDLYFKSEQHEKDLKLLEKTVLPYWKSKYYRDQKSFLYLIAASGKAKHILDCFDTDLEVFIKQKIQKKIALFSTTEQNMIRFALQMLYDQNTDDISLPEAMSYLDDRNRNVMFQAIKIRHQF